ncbi:XkdX family protein [Paenibacillus sp. FSL K6-1230]
MTFWQMAYQWKWVTAEALKGAVKTDSNPFGEITTDEYKTITSVVFA